MKIRIEITDNSIEDEVIIRCSRLSEEVATIERAITEITAGKRRFAFYKGDTEYFLPLEDVLFFETEGREILAHTATEVYQTTYKLYELEELLPNSFMRVSKSTILNLGSIYSITRNISTCVVQFQNTHKQVYVSRYYYKPLKKDWRKRGYYNEKRENFLGRIFNLRSNLYPGSKLGFLQGIGVWSLIWTVFFAALLIKSLVKLHYFGIFISLAFFAIIYAEPLKLTAITPWPVLGAAVLLGIGCSMIFPKRKHKKFYNYKDNVYCGDPNISNESGNEFAWEVNFGSSIKYVNSDSFERANLEVNFGAMTVYFDNATMKGTEARIYIENNFAGTDLYVPKTWTVREHVSNVFGGVNTKGHNKPDGAHTLYLEGENNFGGVTVHFV